MPRKHTRKWFVENGIYHCYNRGVDKQKIFLEDADYLYFLRIIKEALSEPKSLIDSESLHPSVHNHPPMNFFTSITLLGYCLMPNHFHLLIIQNDAHSLDKFLKSICTRYCMYFNKKYKRSGHVFESVYKAILVDDEAYFLHLSRYIHRNPFGMYPNLSDAYSSYAYYLGIRHASWIHPQFILATFQPNVIPLHRHFTTYKAFVEMKDDESALLVDPYAIDFDEN